jgi:hypothetical protein
MADKGVKSTDIGCVRAGVCERTRAYFTLAYLR